MGRITGRRGHPTVLTNVNVQLEQLEPPAKNATRQTRLRYFRIEAGKPLDGIS
jgi:hypothetical protein